MDDKAFRPTEGQAVVIDYTNWEKRRGVRVVTPTGRMEFTSNQWHKTPEWLFYAFDHKNGDVRGFAFNGLHGSRPATPDEVREADGNHTALA